MIIYETLRDWIDPILLNGDHVKNEFECPVYTLSKLLVAVPSESINNTISFVHECDNDCKFHHQATRLYERETVSVDRGLPLIMIMLPIVVIVLITTYDIVLLSFMFIVKC